SVIEAVWRIASGRAASTAAATCSGCDRSAETYSKSPAARRGPLPVPVTAWPPCASAAQARLPTSPLAPVTRRRMRLSGEAGPVLRLVVVAVRAAHHPFPPGAPVHVPAHRLLQPLLEGAAGLPPQLAADLRGVDGVAPVVPGPVGDELDQ